LQFGAANKKGRKKDEGASNDAVGVLVRTHSAQRHFERGPRTGLFLPLCCASPSRDIDHRLYQQQES
jgi:hypothetical protein